MAKRWRVALIGIALVAASCGSDDAGTAAELTSTTTTPATAATTAADSEAADTEVAGATAQSPAPQVDDDRPVAFGEPCGNDQLPVLEQMEISADGGLRARQLPGDGDIIRVLPDGTVVDTFGEAQDCGVLADGSVWFQIGTPLLATGGWVHSGFLEPTTGSTAPASTGDRPAALGDPCGNDQLPVLEQMAVRANRGLRARQLPGDGDIIRVLPDGTVVDTFGEAEDCGVLADGSVWFQIGTPLLATGGWVHSGFLVPAS